VRQACLHLQERGLLTIRRGSGAYFTGLRLPYRIGRRVRLRDNLRAFNVAIAGTIVARHVAPCGNALAHDLKLDPSSPTWRIEIVNRANDVAISSSLHAICAMRFPDLPERLAAHDNSFTAAFASYGVLDYERKSTRIAARLASPDEARRLGVSAADPVLATRSIDITPDNVPLQIVEGAFRADQIELLVEID
jgi:GntR family phosphonate transport system transcriptional regulator